MTAERNLAELELALPLQDASDSLGLLLDGGLLLPIEGHVRIDSDQQSLSLRPALPDARDPAAANQHRKWSCRSG